MALNCPNLLILSINGALAHSDGISIVSREAYGSVYTYATTLSVSSACLLMFTTSSRLLTCITAAWPLRYSSIGQLYLVTTTWVFLFLFSGIMSRSVLLTVAAVIFAPCHILLSYKNAVRKTEKDNR